MSRLGCKCGAEMTNTIVPSRNEINVFYKSEAEEAIQMNPEIRLWDFYSGWDEKNNCENSFQNRKEPVEYWFCTECKRVHEVQSISCGKIIRSFAPHEIRDNQEFDYSMLEKLIVLTDIEMDELLSTNDQLSLSEYINWERPVKYYITEDEKIVYVVKKGRVTCLYIFEEPNKE